MSTKFLKLFMLLTLTTVALSFSSCKPEPEPEPNPAPSQETGVTSIVGTWKCVDNNGDSAILTLNSNHTGSIRVTVDARASITLVENFNWNTSDDTNANHWLEIIHTGGDYWFDSPNMIYILAGNTLRLDGFTYTRM